MAKNEIKVKTLAEYLPSFREIHRSTAPALIGVRF